MNFVQADPIRAPARAQDLILRHRVKNYKAGDLERRYIKLGIEEDLFIVYGFMTRNLHRLMHPRGWMNVNPGRQDKKKRTGVAGVRPHPRHRASARCGRALFARHCHQLLGRLLQCDPHMLDAMHYRGMVRVHRRERGIRIYTPIAPDPGRRQPSVTSGWTRWSISPWGFTPVTRPMPDQPGAPSALRSAAISRPMSPMFGPSGVSIGQMRP